MEEKVPGPQIILQLEYGIASIVLLYLPLSPVELFVHPTYGEMKPTPESTETFL